VDDHPAVREGVRSYLNNQGSVLVVGEAVRYGRKVYGHKYPRA